MIKLYDINMNLVAVLQNAYGISYSKRMNELWTASFSLPADDPKIAECLPFRFVELFDDDERVELFRILPSKFVKSSDGLTMNYQCEHVLGTLLDDLLFQYHQTSNLSPANTLAYILSKQSTPRWQVGTVDFTALYEYKWENENLLSAVFSVPKAYSDEYMWTWDTTTYPWRLNLVRPPSEVSAYIRYGKNLVGITKDEDPTYIVTRLYPLGYGEGDNQLTIKSVNGGVPYLDADTIVQYGVIATTFIDTTEENPAMLKAKALAELQKAKIPRVSYSVSAADIYQITKDPIDRFRDPGILVQAYDEESGLEFAARVVSVQKPNIDSNPGDIKIEISNKVLDITDTTTSLLNRQRISEVYAQGATNIYAYSYADNCDKDHPAIIRIFVPSEAVRINKCLLSYKTEYFRAYEKSIAAGGDIVLSSTQDNTNEVWGGGTVPGEWAMQPALSSPYEHKHNMYEHKHPHAHEIEIPEHTHDIEYGIFKFEEMPDDIIVKVDGNIVSGTGLDENNLDITDFLDKSDGKINRGSFHVVEIYPIEDEENNPNGLARIEANVIVQCFIQSRGGGDY